MWILIHKYFRPVIYIGGMNRDDSSTFVRRQVGKNVEAIRSSRDVSQSLLAKMIGVDRSHINRLENARNNVSLDILVKIADGLDVPITDFFEGLDGEPPRCLADPKNMDASNDKEQRE